MKYNNDRHLCSQKSMTESEIFGVVMQTGIQVPHPIKSLLYARL